MPFDFEKLLLPEIILIKPRIFEDDRGFFMETFKKTDFEKAGIKEAFVQENQSHSKNGVLRGLHYQNPPFAQGKLVRCIRGKIFDVAVDIRKGSPQFGKWTAAELSDDNSFMLYVPSGFAHGFLALSDEADVLYKTTGPYSPDHEAGILWNDAEIGIKWPLIDEPRISEKDLELPDLREADNLFEY